MSGPRREGGPQCSISIWVAGGRWPASCFLSLGSLQGGNGRVAPTPTPTAPHWSGPHLSLSLSMAPCSSQGSLYHLPGGKLRPRQELWPVVTKPIGGKAKIWGS